MVKEYVMLFSSIYISYMDIRYRRIPNATILVTTIFLLVSDIYFSPTLVIPSLLRAACFFFMFNVIFLLKSGLGYGDVKYIALLAYALPFHHVIFTCLTASLTGLLFMAVSRSYHKGIPFVPFLTIGLAGSIYLLTIS